VAFEELEQPRHRVEPAPAERRSIEVPNLDPDLGDRVDSYLRLADRLLPDRITGFYVVGSAALDEYRPGKSDIDFVAVLKHRVGPAGLRRLRVLHVLASARSAWRSAMRRKSPLSGTVNGVFVCEEDLQLPVTRIRPVASHVAGRFMIGRGFDVNPVVWSVLAERAITIRGAAPTDLGLDPEPAVLRDWNLQNLNSYWRSWGHSAASLGPASRVAMAVPRTRMRMVTWGALGAPRLHRTIATGEIVGKAAAGEYALATFGPRWQPLIGAALAHWRGERCGNLPMRAVRRAGEFVLEVVASANKLPRT
jgi:hypothetical protein